MASLEAAAATVPPAGEWGVIDDAGCVGTGHYLPGQGDIREAAFAS